MKNCHRLEETKETQLKSIWDTGLYAGIEKGQEKEG